MPGMGQVEGADAGALLKSRIRDGMTRYRNQRAVEEHRVVATPFFERVRGSAFEVCLTMIELAIR